MPYSGDTNFNPNGAMNAVAQGFGAIGEGIADQLKKKKQAEAQLAGATFGFNTLKQAGLISHEEEEQFLKGNANARNAIVMEATPRLLQKMQQQKMDTQKDQFQQEMVLKQRLMQVQQQKATKAINPYDLLNQHAKSVSGKSWSDWNNLTQNDLAHVKTDDAGNLVGQFQTGKFRKDKDGNDIPLFTQHTMPVNEFQKLKAASAQLSGQPQSEQAPAQPEAPAQPAAKVRVKSPDGKVGMIPADQLEVAKAQGYEPIQ